MRTQEADEVEAEVEDSVLSIHDLFADSVACKEGSETKFNTFHDKWLATLKSSLERVQYHVPKDSILDVVESVYGSKSISSKPFKAPSEVLPRRPPHDVAITSDRHEQLKSSARKSRTIASNNSLINPIPSPSDDETVFVDRSDHGSQSTSVESSTDVDGTPSPHVDSLHLTSEAAEFLFKHLEGLDSQLSASQDSERKLKEDLATADSKMRRMAMVLIKQKELNVPITEEDLDITKGEMSAVEVPVQTKSRYALQMPICCLGEVEGHPMKPSGPYTPLYLRALSMMVQAAYDDGCPVQILHLGMHMPWMEVRLVDIIRNGHVELFYDIFRRMIDIVSPRGIARASFFSLGRALCGSVARDKASDLWVAMMTQVSASSFGSIDSWGIVEAASFIYLMAYDDFGLVEEVMIPFLTGEKGVVYRRISEGLKGKQFSSFIELLYCDGIRELWDYHKSCWVHLFKGHREIFMVREGYGREEEHIWMRDGGKVFMSQGGVDLVARGNTLVVIPRHGNEKGEVTFVLDPVEHAQERRYFAAYYEEEWNEAEREYKERELEKYIATDEHPSLIYRLSNIGKAREARRDEHANNEWIL
ncbi:hypothetical protein NHQ30_007784 [Ciborinia camelliae]|nr:hypothetical protein NHQ30_007784 [Ciborinia camelliae]